MGTRVHAAGIENVVVAGGFWLRRQWWCARVAYRERREVVRNALALGVAMLIVVAAPSVESEVLAGSLPESGPAARAIEPEVFAEVVKSDECAGIALSADQPLPAGDINAVNASP